MIDVDNDQQQILQAIERQIAHGHYPSNDLYGDGTAGTKIAEVLATCQWKIQKTITY